MSVRARLRTMLDVAFDGDFTDDDWEHSLGGVHVWVAESRKVISHGSLVDRMLMCSGETLRVGYVEVVATDVAHRRRGHGTTVMTRIGELIREKYPLGARGHDGQVKQGGHRVSRQPTVGAFSQG